MTNEKVGGLPELPEPVAAYARGTRVNLDHGEALYTAKQMKKFARAALSAHGLPVVDESAQPAEAVGGKATYCFGCEYEAATEAEAAAGECPRCGAGRVADAAQGAVADMAKIGRLIATQDNRITDAPIFIVQQKQRHVADADYDNDGIVWVNDDGQEAGGEQRDRLEAAFQEDFNSEPGGWRRLAVRTEWAFVTACFTEQGCKDYLARDGHNLKEPRIYAAGSYRNEEWRSVRKFLMSLPRQLTTPDTTAAELLGLAEKLDKLVDVWSDDMSDKAYSQLSDGVEELRTLAGKIKESGT